MTKKSGGFTLVEVVTVVLIVLATVLLWPEPKGAEFTMLTQPASLADGRYVRVVFSPNVELSQITILLDKFNLTIVDGPTSRGVYTLGVANSTQSSEALVLSLQKTPDVLFAQPVNIGVDR